MRLFSVILLISLLAGCGGGSTKIVTPPPNVVPVSISLTPNNATVIPSGKQQFQASVLNSDGSTSNNATLTASGNGSIDSATGIFTAAATPGPATVTGTAGSLVADASVMVTAPTQPGPQLVNVVGCGKTTANPSCTWNTTAGNSLVFFLYSDTISQVAGGIILTDSQNNQYVNLIVSGANPNTSSGITEMGVVGAGLSAPLVAGSTTVTPPSEAFLAIAEYSGVTAVDDAANGKGSITSGVGGTAGQLLYNFEFSSGNPNVLGLVFVVAEYPDSINAGASSTQEFQSEATGPFATMMEQQLLPTAGPYQFSFAPSTPAAFNNVQMAVFVTGLR